MRFPWLTISILTIIFISSLICLGYIPKQSDFQLILPFYAVAFLTYLALWQISIAKPRFIYTLLFVALVARIPLVFSMPNLSDDIYRFLWDGHMMLQGYSPFSYTPDLFLAQIPENAEPMPFLQLHPHLNSPAYYSVYPPVSQFLFSLAVWISPNNWLLSSSILKVCLFVGELVGLSGMLRLLDHFNLSKNRILLYALNPLIIIEGIGNLHFEVLMIGLFFYALVIIKQNRFIEGGLWYSLGVATKLFPLMFLPLFIRRLGKKVWLLFSAAALFLFLMFNAVFSLQQVSHFSQSLDLYFQRFEFNASIYYLLRWLGYQWKGYNLIHSIGPLLAVIAFMGILYLYYRDKEKHIGVSFFTTALLAFSLYLFFGTTIHPWYLSFPIALSIFTPFRFPVVWSAVIIATYINYSYTPYRENLWVVGLEYCIVYTFLLYEWIRWRKKAR